MKISIKASLGFGEVVRKVAPINSIIKKYEDDLIEYGRLRNAIVHKSAMFFLRDFLLSFNN